MKKYIIALVVLWIISVTVSLKWNLHVEKNDRTIIAMEGAQAFFKQVVLTRTWNAEHGGVYVLINDKVKPNPYLKIPFRDVETTSGKKLTKINPAFMTRQVAEIAARTTGVQFHITSLNPIRPQNKADSWERTALNSFANGKKHFGDYVFNASGEKAYRYMAPLFVEKGCLKCHAVQGYKLGDIRGGISVMLPFSKETTNWQLWLTHIMALFVVTTVFIFFGGKLERNRKKIIAANMALEESMDRLKKTQSQLVQSEKMAGIGTLVAGVAHEINNPINFVNSCSQSLEERTQELQAFINELMGEEPDQEIMHMFEEKFTPIFKNLSTILDGSQRIKTIVTELRTFSRLDEAEKKRVNVLEGLRSTINLTNTQYRDQVEFVYDFQADLELECWPAQLNQVFMNMIVNACQAIISKQKQTGDKISGKLTISTQVQDQSLAVRFQDTGCGIPKEIQSKLFEPFFTTKEVGEGTGMGLSISFGIVERHQGKILFESTEGEGTTFTILLPLELEIT
jgi:two-component system, NtrC family, sensor kinase